MTKFTNLLVKEYRSLPIKTILNKEIPMMGSVKKMHGLRHVYAKTRYESLTGWKSPKAGGLASKDLTPQQQIKDQ